MARYSLRNKKKISDKLGIKNLTRIVTSLNEAFKTDLIELHSVEGEKHQILNINDTGHSCGLILFYVIRKTYDVYNLAFKEFVN